MRYYWYIFLCQLAPPSSDNPHRRFLKKEREFVHAFLLYKGLRKKNEMQKQNAKKAVPFHHTLLSLRAACCPRSSTGCFCLCFPNLHSSCQVLFCASKSPFPERLLGYWGPCPIEARKLTHACLNMVLPATRFLFLIVIISEFFWRGANLQNKVPPVRSSIASHVFSN